MITGINTLKLPVIKTTFKLDFHPEIPSNLCIFHICIFKMERFHTETVLIENESIMSHSELSLIFSITFLSFSGLVFRQSLKFPKIDKLTIWKLGKYEILNPVRILRISKFQNILQKSCSLKFNFSFLGFPLIVGLIMYGSRHVSFPWFFAADWFETRQIDEVTKDENQTEGSKEIVVIDSFAVLTKPCTWKT